MKEDTISLIFDVIAGIVTIAIIGCVILLLPYHKAARRDAQEQVIIDDYLEEQAVADTLEQPAGQADDLPESLTETTSTPDGIQNAETTYSQLYKGEIDSILMIDKINLQKAIIRGPDNHYNLDRYLFVTKDQSSVLGIDNYVIYGHCSQTYGHSFNRLEELVVGDTFRLLQGDITYEYTVTGIQLELRENATPLLETGTNTVQLISCEKRICPITKQQQHSMQQQP